MISKHGFTPGPPPDSAGRYKAQVGTWTLTAPDGRQWTGDSPLAAAGAEQRERIPASVMLQRIDAALAEDEARPASPAAEPEGLEGLHIHTTLLWNCGEEKVPCKICGWPKAWTTTGSREAAPENAGLVERLRRNAAARKTGGDHYTAMLETEAASRIEALSRGKP